MFKSKNRSKKIFAVTLAAAGLWGLGVGICMRGGKSCGKCAKLRREALGTACRAAKHAGDFISDLSGKMASKIG
jgi:hypothetical protein